MENYAHILQTLEKACLDFQRQPNKQNEQVLLEFRKTPGILPAAAFILEHSKVGIVQFQAIGAITESALRDWATMKPEEVEAVKNVMFKFVTQNANLPGSAMYVVQQALQTLSVIVKRGWIPDEDKENFPGPAQHGIFNQISQLLAGEPQYQFIAVLLCQALVLEFSSSSKSTPLGVPWAYHVLSMQTFEEHYLGKIFVFIMQLLQGIFKRGSQLQEIEVRMISKSFNLLSTILSWPFDDYSSFLGFGFTTSTSGKSFHPGSQWNELLVKNFDTLRFFFESYSLVRHDRSLLHMVGECLIQLASLSGDVFAKEAENLSYFNAFLPGLFHLVSLPNLSTNEILSLSRMFDRVTTNFSLKLITQSQLFEAFLQNFTQFSCMVLKNLSDVDDINDRTYFNEAFDNLLEAWDFLARDADTLTGEPAARLQQYTAQIFRMYLETKLKIARAELYEERDEDEQQDAPSDYIQYEEQLVSIANLGRLDALNAANLLTETLTERLNQANKFLQQGPASGVMIVTLLEEIHWLVIIAGGFLCDSPEGEEPSVPAAVANLSLAASSRNQADPIMGLISIVMHIANFEKDCLVNKKNDMWSPLVTETISWFLCRWTESYLLKGDHTSPSLAMAYDEPAQALSVVDFMFLKVVTNLVYLGGEEKVAKNTGDLLLAISKLKLPGASLVGLGSWKQLLELYMRLLTSDPASDVHLSIPLETQRKIICGLIKMSRKWAPNEKQSYFEQLITPLETGLIGTLQDPEFVKKSSNPLVMKRIEKYLEDYRGIIQAASKENIELIFNYCSKFFQAFVQLITVYKDYYEVVALLLHVYNDFAKYALPYLPTQAATVFVNACGAFFKAFQATGLGKTAIVKNKDLHAQQEKEQYKEMLLILKMLANLLEFEQDNVGESNGKWIAETVFYGLSVIIPLITRDILFFPKLCTSYYGVITSVFRCYIGQIHEIPDPLYVGIIGSLQFALKHSNNNIVSTSLDAIRALADESQVIHHPNKRESLPQLLQAILTLVLLEDNFSMDLIDTAGSTLFALFFIQQDTYTTFVQQLIQQTDPNNQQRLAQAFTKLTTVNPKLVNSREEFGTSFLMEFHDFVSTARSLLKKC